MLLIADFNLPKNADCYNVFSSLVLPLLITSTCCSSFIIFTLFSRFILLPYNLLNKTTGTSTAR